MLNIIVMHELVISRFISMNWKKPHVGPRRRVEDNIGMDLKEILHDSLD
jgi:hypothetical protein